MVDTKRIPRAMTDDWLNKTLGRFLDDRHYLPAYRCGGSGGRAVNVLKPTGRLLFAYRPGLIGPAYFALALPALRRAARPTTHRHDAAGGAAELFSGTLGYLNGRPTSATRELWGKSGPGGWRDVLPLLRLLDTIFRAECPDQYAVLAAAADALKTAALRWDVPSLGRPPTPLIPRTALSAVTVNRWTATRNARMAAHRDGGNLSGGYGVMTVWSGGTYAGGLLVFPRYLPAVDLRPGDVLIADNREAHGNTPLSGGGGPSERVSVVGYFHDSNRPARGAPAWRPAGNE